MDRAKPLPTLPALEAQEVRALLPTLPRYILWNCAEEVRSFFNLVRTQEWEPDEEWMSETIKYMLEYIADYPSSEELLHDYAHQVCNSIGDGIHALGDWALPHDPDYLQQQIVTLGLALRESLQRMGLYRYKGALLYKFVRFQEFDIVLEPLDPAEIPCVESYNPGEPGWRQL